MVKLTGYCLVWFGLFVSCPFFVVVVFLLFCFSGGLDGICVLLLLHLLL